MNTKEQVYLIGLLLGIVLLIGPQGRAQPKPEAKGPNIIHALAVERGYYGSIWKIYLEVEDPDGQMFRIACNVEQTGYGMYPTNWIFLKSEFQKYFKGYIQWNTFSSKGIPLKEGDQIILRISVFDKVGNESREVVFPFTFVSGINGHSKPPAPFDQGDIPRLGFINIDLKSPGMIY
jgi:hypothetical protein